MSEPFRRQRRYVFVASAILLALCLGEVEIRDLTFAGMTFGAFKKPEVFLLGVWIAFGYFTYRYLVYFIEDSLQVLSTIWSREFERAVNPRIESLVKQAYAEPNDACRYSYAFIRRDGFAWIGQALLPMDDAADMKEMKNITLPLPRKDIALWELKGFFRFVFLTPAATEYFLPFTLAIGTFIYCGFIAAWEGSFRALAG